MDEGVGRDPTGEAHLCSYLIVVDFAVQVRLRNEGDVELGVSRQPILICCGEPHVQELILTHRHQACHDPCCLVPNHPLVKACPITLGEDVIQIF